MVFDVYLEYKNVGKFLIKKKTHRHVQLHTYGKLKPHRESVPLIVSTAVINVFKNCTFGDYPPAACKI